MARDRDRGPRLDVPSDSRRGISVPSVDQEAAGRLSEAIARFLGSWRFIGYMTAFILIWLTWNAFGPTDLRFDDYPFIFLTLVLSIQASYAAPLILLAQNRQTDRDRVQYQADRDRGERLVADSEYLARELAALRAGIGEVATRDFIRDVGRDQVVGNDAGGPAEPEHRHAGQHPSLVGDLVREDHVVDRDPVRRDQQQVLFELVDLPHLAG